jgi:hypothetical protein
VVLDGAVPIGQMRDLLERHGTPEELAALIRAG